MNDQQRAYSRAVADFGTKVHAVGDDQWTNDTPCTEWDVRALVNHVVYENLWVPELIGGRTVAEVGDRFDGDVLEADPFAAWDRSAEAAVAAVAADAAVGRTVDTSGGRVSVTEYVSEIFLDAVIHGWDLARGIGVNDTIDPAFAEQLYSELAPREAELKSFGVYGDVVEPPVDADTQAKLLAILGRVQ